MQVVKLKSGVHSVNNGVLVDKSGELSHDGLNQASGVREVVHHMAAGNDFVLSVHAVVESGNTVDVVNLVDSDSAVDYLGNMPGGGQFLSNFDALVSFIISRGIKSLNHSERLK